MERRQPLRTVPDKPQPAHDPDELMTYDDVARLHKVKTHTARAWACSGDPRLPPAITHGKNYVRFRRRDVLERIDAMQRGELVPA